MLMRVRIREQINRSGIVVATCCRPPDEEDEVEEVFFRQLEETIQSQLLVLLWNYNHPDTCRRNSTRGHKQSRFPR